MTTRFTVFLFTIILVLGFIAGAISTIALAPTLQQGNGTTNSQRNHRI